MKKYILILSIILVSCHGPKNNKINNVSKSNAKEVLGDIDIRKSQHRKFYNADKIEHYYLDISEDDARGYLTKKDRTNDDLILAKLLMFGYLDPISDSLSESNIEIKLKKFKFVKTTLTEAKKTQVENIFTENDTIPTSVSSCLPYYRDFFVFKRNDSIIGASKICFGCGVSVFIGSKINTDGFGLYTDREKLENIVRNK